LGLAEADRQQLAAELGRMTSANHRQCSACGKRQWRIAVEPLHRRNREEEHQDLWNGRLSTQRTGLLYHGGGVFAARCCCVSARRSLGRFPRQGRCISRSVFTTRFPPARTSRRSTDTVPSPIAAAAAHTLVTL
jgi:hypothetical protein